MALVNFTLSEDGVSAFNDALVCIHKFSDDVSLEIKKDKVSTSVRHPHWSCPFGRTGRPGY
jgi:cell cycle checkpoint control protein RAD9A